MTILNFQPEEGTLKQMRNWIEIVGEALKQLGQLLQGQRPALQPVPIRSNPPQSPR